MSTPQLIDELAAAARPVRRLRPPALRAALWLIGFVALAAVIVTARHAWSVPAARAQPGLMVAMVGAALTGVAAVLAAFNLALPDRSRWWLLAPLPGLALWLGASGVGCYHSWLVVGARQSLALGESTHCFLFILGVSVPVSLALYLPLRRALPLHPLSVLLTGALGVAALTAVTLQFFHPFDITMMDLAAHLAAVLVAVGIAALLGAPMLRRAPQPH
ncbi:MAG TPA: NrsF family protein [Steroidobacteraceae bacterium]